MIDYLVFNPETGEIVASGMCPLELVERQAPEGFRVTAQRGLPGINYVDLETGEIRDCGSRPSAWHRFDYATHAWEPDTTLAGIHARTQRDKLLLACDWTQLPDVPAHTKTAWTNYRQALRDITRQSGFPLEVAWPTPPLVSNNHYLT